MIIVGPFFCRCKIDCIWPFVNRKTICDLFEMLVVKFEKLKNMSIKPNIWRWDINLKMCHEMYNVHANTDWNEIDLTSSQNDRSETIKSVTLNWLSVCACVMPLDDGHCSMSSVRQGHMKQMDICSNNANENESQ